MARRGDGATTGGRGPTSALGRTRALFAPGREAQVTGGYLDALGDGGVPRSATQVAMGSRLLPRVYEAAWRPLLFGAASLGLRERAEAALMLSLLDLGRGDTALDVACGPGNTTRRLVDAVGPEGLLVGVDAAPSMVGRAVRDTQASTIAYVRADGADLPFADGTFDAASCFGALYLVDRPFDVLAELVRVLAPGGRVAILTSCLPGPSVARAAVNTASSGAAAGFRWFGPDEITGALEAHGLRITRRDIHGVMQYVGAVRD